MVVASACGSSATAIPDRSADPNATGALPGAPGLSAPTESARASESVPAPGASATSGGAVQGPPPWNPPADTAAAMHAAGLEPLTAEGTVQHTHTALQVWYQGQRVTVPANIGIDQNAGTLSAIHTHDASGIIHVESPVPATFRLGQFFMEWGVSLAGAAAWVDGTPAPDPAAIVLVDRQFVVVTWGPPPQPVPATYTEGYFPGDQIPDLVPAIDLADRPAGFAPQGVSLRVNGAFAYMSQVGGAAGSSVQGPVVNGKLRVFQVKAWASPNNGALQLWTWEFGSAPEAAAFFAAYDPALPGMAAPTLAADVAPGALVSLGANASAADGSVLGMVAWSTGPYVFELLGASPPSVLTAANMRSVAAHAAAAAARLASP
jgi:hypothetical protein